MLADNSPPFLSKYCNFCLKNLTQHSNGLNANTEAEKCITTSVGPSFIYSLYVMISFVSFCFLVTKNRMHSFIFGQETEWYFIHTVVELHVEHGVISNKVFEQYFFL